MIQKRDITNIFINEIYIQKDLRKNYPTNKVVYKGIDDTWSTDLIQMDDYGIKNNDNYKYILTIIDNFTKFAWCIPLQNKYGQTITNEFSTIINKSKRKPKKIHTDQRIRILQFYL